MTSKVSLYAMMIGMLVTGSAVILLNKWQDQTLSDCNVFTHPYLQGMVMFLGMFFCWVIFFIKKMVCKSPETD
jgi:hypothetical protein